MSLLKNKYIRRILVRDFVAEPIYAEDLEEAQDIVDNDLNYYGKNPIVVRTGNTDEYHLEEFKIIADQEELYLCSNPIIRTESQTRIKPDSDLLYEGKYSTVPTYEKPKYQPITRLAARVATLFLGHTSLSWLNSMKNHLGTCVDHFLLTLIELSALEPRYRDSIEILIPLVVPYIGRFDETHLSVGFIRDLPDNTSTLEFIDANGVFRKDTLKSLDPFSLTVAAYTFRKAKELLRNDLKDGDPEQEIRVVNAIKDFETELVSAISIMKQKRREVVTE